MILIINLLVVSAVSTPLAYFSLQGVWVWHADLKEGKLINQPFSYSGTLRGLSQKLASCFRWKMLTLRGHFHKALVITVCCAGFRIHCSSVHIVAVNKMG